MLVFADKVNATDYFLFLWKDLIELDYFMESGSKRWFYIIGRYRLELVE